MSANDQLINIRNSDIQYNNIFSLLVCFWLLLNKNQVLLLHYNWNLCGTWSEKKWANIYQKDKAIKSSSIIVITGKLNVQLLSFKFHLTWVTVLYYILLLALYVIDMRYNLIISSVCLYTCFIKKKFIFVEIKKVCLASTI